MGFVIGIVMLSLIGAFFLVLAVLGVRWLIRNDPNAIWWMGAIIAVPTFIVVGVGLVTGWQ
jgi:hypothetical protein